MKKLTLTALFLLSSLSAFPALAGVRKIFPDDYKPHVCAPEVGCNSFPRSQLTQGGAALRGYTMDVDWIERHWAEMMEAFRPICAKIATCYATPPNRPTFCTEVVESEAYAICDRFTVGTEDSNQCERFVRAYSIGYDMGDKAVSAAARKCTAEKAPLGGAPRPIDVWTVPEKLDATYDGKFRVYAIDRETRVPIQASVLIGGKRLFTKDPPSGKSETHYFIFWDGKLPRVPNCEGHTDLVVPAVRVEAAGYEAVEFAMPMDVPKMIVEMDPPATKLKRGKNVVTFKARDAATGQPVEARVMIGERILGATNKPVELQLERGRKRPEIWATSLFDRYGDVVVLPQEK